MVLVKLKETKVSNQMNKYLLFHQNLILVKPIIYNNFF